MPKSVSNYLRVKVASRVVTAKLLPGVGIDLDYDADPVCADKVYSCVKNQPVNLIRDCCIKTLGFDDLGPSAKYYPNHGYYRTPGDVLVLNTRMLEDPVHGVSDDGRDISTFEFILAHELGHGWDAAQGHKIIGNDYSLCPEWLRLSDWSEGPKPGHKRLRIVERGYPEKVGEWYYGPSARFSRYYGKMNPWDDWADAFAYYVTGMKNKLPKEKLEYFDTLLSKYYDGSDYESPGVFKYSHRHASQKDQEYVNSLLKQYPEFMEALIRYTADVKELSNKGNEYGVVIPTLGDYVHNYLDKDEGTIKKYLGRVPLKEEGLMKVIEEFTNKQKSKPEMKGDLPSQGLFHRLFTRSPGMKSVKFKIAGTLLDIADTLDCKGMILQAAEIRSVSKRVAADAKEVFTGQVSGRQVSIDSIEEFIEGFKPTGKDPFIESLKAYQKYIQDKLDDVLLSFGDDQKKNKAKDIFEGVVNVVGMALKDFEKPVPGRTFKDPMAPTQQ
jgi:hypothetical protein